MRRFAIGAGLLVLSAVAVPVAAQSPVRGALARGDATLRSGEYYDEHTFTARVGQRVTIDLASTDFDPYLILIGPTGERHENDDWQQSNEQSRLERVLTEGGRYRVLVTSYRKGETGGYELRTTIGGAVSGAGGDGRHEAGELASGDRTLASGEFFDEYGFDGRAGEAVTVDLRSAAFDTYLLVVAPDGSRQENDDHDGDRERSLVSFNLAQDGRYRVLVTSYAKDESGAYSLDIHQGGGDRAGPAAVSAREGSRAERGRLERGDRTLGSGEYVDTFTFDARPGQHVTIDLASKQFDTFLVVIPAGGDRVENDDVDDNRGHSRLELDVAEPGSHRVLVTSYAKDEIGDYELRIDVQDAPQTAASSGAARGRDLVTVAYGAPQAGRLETTDGRIQSGEYRDLYAFDGRAGDRVVVELASDDFDPYLVLMPPSGESIDNDDADGQLDRSRIDLTLAADGRYRVLVTSYAAGETGAYRLAVRNNGAAAPVGRPVTARSGSGVPTGRVYGVFVGISDYGGRANDLEFTADDARRMEQALVGNGMRPDDSLLLVDRQATRAAVQRAIASVAQRATADDTFVFFYSGHGGRELRPSQQAAEADGQDETLALFDADVVDDELARWLGPVRAKYSLIVLDSCFSGGFQKDLIAAPYTRMGLFSSEEDVLSSIASKFEAGGYLAHFFAEAIADRRGDLDDDGAITAIELSQYLRERYRSDVKSGPGSDDDYVSVGGRRTGYQHLVVDRGSVRPNDVLFVLP